MALFTSPASLLHITSVKIVDFALIPFRVNELVKIMRPCPVMVTMNIFCASDSPTYDVNDLYVISDQSFTLYNLSFST
jgi:hypothetical protein